MTTAIGRRAPAHPSHPSRRSLAAKPLVDRTQVVQWTNPDKLMYPASGFTKRQVLTYYDRIAPVLLPHLAGHPVSLKRLPDGVDGIAFFEKRAPANRPAWVHTAEVTSSAHGRLTYVVIDNQSTLLWLANRAALELHPFLFHAFHEDRADMMVFDLDPGAPAGLGECLPLALEIRDLLAEVGLRSFAKTSGGKGLHVLVPIGGTATFAMTKAFARATALALEAHHPAAVTSVMAKDRREGKVFIDWSQNDHGKTTVAAYSLRARERPTVSAPLSWEEVEQAAAKGSAERLVFTADQVIRRVSAIGDLLAPALGMKQKLPTTTDLRRKRR